MKKLISILVVISILLSLLHAIPVFAVTEEGITIQPESSNTAYAADGYQMTDLLPDVPRTIQTKIKLDANFSASSSAGIIMGNYSYSSTKYFNLSIDTNGNPKVSYRVNAGANTVLFDKVDVRTGEYVDLAVAFDRTSGYWHCYVDGVLKQSVGKFPDIDDSVLNMPFCLGGHYTVLSQNIYFKGEIKNIAVYSDTRSVAEIGAGLDAEDENLLVAYELSAKQPAADLSKNGIDLIYNDFYLEEGEYADAISREDYEYAFAVIGDPHTPQHGAGKLETMFQWIEDNKESKNIQYAFCVGDLSNTNSDSDWTRIKACFDMLSIPYSVVRGNHDFDVTGNDFTYSNGINFNKYFATDENYASQFTGENGGLYVGKADANSDYATNSVANTYRTFEVGGQKWLFLNLDFGAPDDVLNWADGILSQYPDHKVIVNTHGYLNLNGTRDSEPYAYTSDERLNSGEDIWKKLLSKHENVEITLSGHHLLDDVVVVQDTGVNGNTVTQIFTNPQQPNQRLKGLGLVTMLYFGKDGKSLKIEHYSTVRNAHFKICNQIEIDLDKDVSGVDKSVWDGTAVAPEGEGTEQSPYLVESAGNLLWMSVEVANGNSFDGKYFEQTNDIDLAGGKIKSIGYYYNNDTDKFTFDGSFDGKGFAIKNGTVIPVKSDAAFTKAYGYGLFGAIYGAEIKNITLEKITVNGVGVTGALVGKSCGKSDGSSQIDLNTVSNCTVKNSCKIVTSGAGNSTAFDDISRAGVLGGIIGAARSVTVEYCSASILLVATDEFNIVGGIAGTAGYNAKIDNCKYTGRITLEATNMTKEAAIGGILGMNSPSTVTTDVGDAKAGSLIISNCYNNAPLLSHIVQQSPSYWGGIAGYIANLPALDTRTTAPSYKEDVPFMIDNCHNRYAINTGAGTSAAVAGLLGKAYCDSAANNSTIWIRDCSSVSVTRLNSGLNGYNIYNYKSNKTKYGFYPAQYYNNESGVNSNSSGVTDVNILPAVAKIDSDKAIYELNLLGSVDWSFDAETGTLDILGAGSMVNFAKGKTPWAEYTTEIKTVNISADIITIGDYAFTDCVNLETINLPSGLIYIGASAFDGTPFIKNHTGWQNNLLIIQNVIVKASQSADGNYTIPETVTSICGGAFADLAVDTVTYGGKISDWNTIYVGIDNAPIENAQFVYEGEAINSRFDSKTGTLTIFGTGATPSYNDTSSNTPWYKYKDQIKAIVIEDGITALGNYLAKGFTGVESVTLPEGLISIGTACFEGHSFTSITLPETLQTIGNYAFNACAKLTSIDIPASVKNLNRYAFYNNTQLATITGGEGITSMGKSVLDGTAYKKDTSKYEDGVLYVGAALALATQSDDNTYFIKEGTKAIAENAFANLTVEKVTFDGSSEQWAGIGKGAGNEALDSATIVYLSNSYLYEYDEETATLTITGKGPMGNYATDLSDAPYYEYKTTAKKVILSKGITTVGSNVFRGMTALETVELPDGITSIGSNAFRDSTITSIDIPSTVTTIGGNAFYNIKTLTSVVIPEGVTTLGSSVFRNTTNLAYVYLPSTLTSLPLDTFRSCTYLATVDMYPTLTSINEGAFRACSNLETVNYFGSAEQKAVTIAGTTATQNTNFINATFKYTFGAAFNKNTKVLTVYGAGAMPNYNNTASDTPWYSTLGTVQKVIIKSGITKISNNAFKGFKTITSVDLPDSITSIGTAAFQNCTALKNITLPEGLTSLGTYSFYATAIESITVPEAITVIGHSTFRNCSVLSEVEFKGNVTELGQNSFYNTKALKKLEIPGTLTTVVQSAFNGAGLKEIVFFGTTEQFNAISVSTTSNEAFINANVVCMNDFVIRTANVTINNDLSVNFKVYNHLFEGAGYENPVLTANGKKITEYTVDGDMAVFTVRGIAPHKMGDAISVTLSSNGISTTTEFVISGYLKALMSEYADDAKLLTLVIDALNYGAAAQVYKNYNIDNLVNASLTDAQKTIRDAGEVENCISVSDEIEETATWKNHSLYLEDSVSIKLGFESELDNLNVIVKDQNGNVVDTITEIYKTPYGRYYFYFDNLNVSQIDDVFTFTIMSGDAVASETLTYSAASYISLTKADTALATLTNSLLAYGRSALNYIK